MKNGIMALIALIIAGCAMNQAQQQSQQAAGNNVRQEALERIQSYCNGLMATPDLDPIRSKVVLVGDVQPTFDMLANTQHVSTEERPAIREWAELTIQCQAQAKSFYMSYGTPMHITTSEAAFDSVNALKAQLYNGQLTYGDYNRERQKVLTNYKAAIQQINQELLRRDAEAQYRAQQIAQQQWQNSLLLQQNVQQQMQAYQQQYQQQHGTITCNRIGMYTYCNY